MTSIKLIVCKLGITMNFNFFLQKKSFISYLWWKENEVAGFVIFLQWLVSYF